MKVKSRILLIALIAVLMMAMICTGCGQTGSGDSDGQTGTEAEEQASADDGGSDGADNAVSADTGTGKSGMAAAPFEAVTEMDAQMEDKLTEFLKLFANYQNATTYSTDPSNNTVFYYDCNTAAQCGLLNALMGNLGIMGMLNLYPDSGYEQLPLEDGQLPPGFPFGGDRVPSLSYSKANVDAINWIATNIFNAPSSELQGELELASRVSMEEPVDSRTLMYVYDGYYYRLSSSGGGPGIEIVIDNISLSGDHFIVTYTEKYYMGSDEPYATKQLKADLQYKKINGIGYWSLYRREAA